MFEEEMRIFTGAKTIWLQLILLVLGSDVALKLLIHDYAELGDTLSRCSPIMWLICNNSCIDSLILNKIH
jgi:hypothetical protein